MNTAGRQALSCIDKGIERVTFVFLTSAEAKLSKKVRKHWSRKRQDRTSLLIIVAIFVGSDELRSEVPVIIVASKFKFDPCCPLERPPPQSPTPSFTWLPVKDQPKDCLGCIEHLGDVRAKATRRKFNFSIVRVVFYGAGVASVAALERKEWPPD